MARVLKSKTESGEKYRELALRWGSPRKEVFQLFITFRSLKSLKIVKL